MLPELATAGYVFASLRRGRRRRDAPDDALFAAWADAVRPAGAVVVGGFVERAGDGRCSTARPSSTAAACSPCTARRTSGIGSSEWFVAGDEPPPVVETAVGRIGVAICYDLEFPEVTRHLALAGAELIAVPTNWPLVDRPAGERPPEVVIAMAAARVNRVAIACCDRAGTERGQRWTEGSTIIAADGWPVAAAGGGVRRATADIDLARSATTSASATATTRSATGRRELYGAVQRTAHTA